MTVARQWIVAGFLLAASAAFAEPAVLETRQGKLEGVVTDGIRVFKQIPYALPPVGARRWRYAEPAPGWEGTRLATRFGAACAQVPYGEGSFFSRPNEPTSEDCLTLNVWSADRAGKQPVMVWIHGGALTRGSGSTNAYDGTALAQKGVVVVTINYRLGVFGYLAHPELTAESGFEASGNYGTSDQVAALRWVRDNIGDYGGDADNVTIFGESAGSWSVHHMMATPGARGLFHRAIGQSGARMGRMPDLAQGERAGMQLQQAAGVDSLADLRALPAGLVLNAARKGRVRTRDIVDGHVFPRQIKAIFEAGEQHGVPVMVGYNAEEGTTLGVLQRLPADAAAYEAGVRQRSPRHADQLLALYPSSDVRRASLDSFRDSVFGWGMHTWARLNATTGHPAFLYYFSARPQGEALGAYHAAEIIYAFDNVRRIAPRARRADRKLADVMSDYWVAFARTGMPVVKGQPTWEAYRAADRNYLEFRDGKAIPGAGLMEDAMPVLDAMNAAR